MDLKRRRILLINPSFQLKYCLYVCTWVFILSLLYPYLIYDVYEMFTNVLAASPGGPDIALIRANRKQVGVLLIILQISYLFLIFGMSLFLSHRIAGPLFKLKKTLTSLMQGNLDPVYFRKFDHFQDLSDTYNQAVSQLKADLLLARESLEKAKTGQINTVQLEEAVNKLSKYN